MRKIKFSEEDGTLVGNDHGYRHKLIALGEDKFINPDDGAPFVFNTKNKSAVTLLLFETVDLKKVEASRGKEVMIADFVKKVPVSADYLKLLEGEYISANDPNGVRKITIVEEKGELLGNDNGYHYTLIPVGDGKFINPDDGAAMVFDTKNKDAVNLLLFGTIDLKKVK